jgi:chloramphenicol 3-O phosphotransferase
MAAMTIDLPPGKIILVNGASSAGKSALARRLQSVIAGPFWNYSIDHLRAGKIVPFERIDNGEFRWSELRGQFFEGFHRSLPAFALAGNNLIVEYIVETREWMDRLLELLEGLDVFFVGLHCALPELERREAARGDRRIGEARTDFETTHQLCSYDLELDSTSTPVDEMVGILLNAWNKRRAPCAFERMQARS